MCSFEDMIFFDDSTMNTVEIERMGVLCAHCPRGLTSGIWDNALKEFAKMKVSERHRLPLDAQAR